MTWSLIARDPSGAFGIAVATKNFAVGCRVPFIQSGIGAIATQALVNPFYGAHGLMFLQDEMPPEEIIQILTEGDAGRDQRQVHIMDRHGRIAAHTGSACIDWCGHTSGEGFSVAGNMLAGPAVLADTIRTFEAQSALPFARRLIAAMQAGEAAGGDKRGKQSAALLVHDGEDYPLYDLRVDDHADPLGELARLHEVARERWVHFRRWMPSRENPSGLTDRSGLEALVAKSIAEGYE
jgi:uncharacterized Ntn-hydrolase superfamily protein